MKSFKKTNWVAVTWVGLLAVSSLFSACSSQPRKRAKASSQKSLPADYRDQNSYFYYLMSQLKEGDAPNEELEKYLDQAIKEDKDSSFLLTNKAYLEARDGDIAKSRANALEALKLNPHNADIYVLLGKLASFEKDSLEAISYYKKSLAYDDENEDVYNLIAREYYLLNDFRNMEKSLKQCMAKLPESAVCPYYLATAHLERKNYSEAIVYYKRTAELQPGQVKILQTIAEIHFETEDYENALEIYKEIFRLNPEDLAVQIRIGLLYYNLGQVAFAIEVFEKIQARFPNSDRVNYYLGLMYLDRENYVSALDVFSRITNESSFFKDAILKQFYILEQQNRVDELPFVLEAHLSAAKEPWIYLFLGSFLYERESYEKSAEYLSRGIKQFGKDEDLLFQRAQAYERLDQWKDAKDDLQMVIENHPNSAKAYNYLGYSMAERGEDLQEALKLVEKSVELEPNKAYSLDSLGWIHFKLGNTEKALTYIKRAAELDEKEPVIMEHLADIYLVLKDKNRARSYYQKSLDLLKGLEKKQQHHLEQIEKIEIKLSEF